jgi:uncharacterized peroxidase-related enzyme
MLADLARKNGFVANMFGVMAEAPTLLRAYLMLGRLFEETSLTPIERQVVALTVSATNGCEYCVAAHTVIARMEPDAVVRALRVGTTLSDPQLESLRRFTAALVLTRGRPAAEDLTAFVSAGYGEAHVLEVILGVGMKTMSNYTHHLAHTPVDAAFARAAWTDAA